MKTQAKLLAKYMDSAGPGYVEWLGLRPSRRADMLVQSEVTAKTEKGLCGDHSAKRASGSARQVTLINAEDIQALSSLLDLASINPSVLRRNIVVSGINLHAMRYQLLKVGDAIVEIGAHCHPCSRMEKALGAGTLLAMFNRGGYCARVVQGGSIKVGDTVRVTQLQRELF
ncbi:hypothetical protein A3742_16820 [Oleiphilus sp. HI0071]|jgi:MOSC domain-containing protein YiiM|uniref:MOSC domain-containing protein n=1 Tax=unclassified Oleiphilus TaxID=2631174 RepID=UPI0007C3EA26|nr:MULTISPECIES: MOSC domain-containing protein [unclassified Oleiphilus]KZY68202.1 hypothetical protein A3737_02465 [Oleiphilus sp. HI0065]KZY79910.1 hypothetical protein A3742_13780 [Oleiphilus sp. HI0071]KZY92265.1 hypothetical protein A3744_19475 [Oleiphilus sp. HI0073]KZZ42980.1 hypothetical protein A3758_05280 [Oleiphilus sp. HI0118]KZZ49967.1 hypothetical protein A3760_14595 [Oleiphilus sp. HI0122]KZZ65289.1 hypothetical protein A3765_06070 [Oleiphilus sp. HI0130]KZZ77465.1 hypothetic